MGCTLILEQEPGGGYMVHAPALPGCVSQGNTREEVLTNIREAMELYIEDCIDVDDLVPKEVDREFIEVERNHVSLSQKHQCITGCIYRRGFDHDAKD